MLDRVDALLDRDLRAVDALAVRGDAVARRWASSTSAAISARVSCAGSGSSSSTLRAPVVITLMKSAPRRSCSRTARRTSSAPSASRYMPPNQRPPGAVAETISPQVEQARAAEGPVAHRLAGLEDEVAIGADVADRRDAAAQRLAQVGGEQVRVGPRPAAARRRGRVAGGWPVACACASISPGISVRPASSIARAPFGAASDAARDAAMRPSSTRTAASSWRRARCRRRGGRPSARAAR